MQGKGYACTGRRSAATSAMVCTGLVTAMAAAGAAQATHLSGPVDHLQQVRPSLFHSRATIRFSLARTGQVEVTIYDVAGRRVRQLVDGPLAGGEHSLTWDALGDDGRRLGAGVYWVQMATESGYRSSRRMLVMR